MFPTAIGSLWNNVSELSKSLNILMTPNSFIDEKKVILAFDILLWEIRDEISGDKIAFIVNDTILLQQFIELAHNVYVTPSIIFMTTKVWIIILAFVKENWNPHEKYFNKILFNVNCFFNNWYGEKRKRDSKTCIHFLPLVESILLVFTLHNSAIMALGKARWGVFDIARAVILNRVQLTTANTPNSGSQFSTLNLTINYLNLVNTNNLVDQELMRSNFIQQLIKEAIESLDEPKQFYYCVKAFSFISDSLTKAELNELCRSNAHILLNSICKRHMDVPNVSSLEYCFKCHSLFNSSDVLHLVAYQAISNELFMNVIWDGGFGINGQSTEFYSWISNVIESKLITNLTTPQIKATGNQLSGAWLSSIIYESMDIEERDVKLISKLIANSIKSPSFNDPSEKYVAEFNYNSLLVKLLIARINMFYAFNEIENEEFLTVLLSIIKKCQGTPVLNSKSPLAMSLMDLVDFQLPGDKFNIDLLVRYSFSSPTFLPNHLQFIKWLRFLNNEAFIVQSNLKNFEGNKKLLKRAFIDLYVIIKCNELLQ